MHRAHRLPSLGSFAFLTPLLLTLSCGGFTSEIDSDEWTDSQEEAAKSRSVKIHQTGPAELRTRPTERISISYNWSGGPTSKSLINFIHFVNAEGATIYQDDHLPSVPTNQWTKEARSEVREYLVPQDAPLGTLRVFAGLYDGGPGGSGARLKLKKGAGVTEDATSPRRYLVGTVVIEAPAVVSPPGTPSFTRAYAGVPTATWSPRWSWSPATQGGSVERYRVSPSFGAPFETTETTWSPYFAYSPYFGAIPVGNHTVSVVAINSSGESPAVTDTVYITNINPNNNSPNHHVYGVTEVVPDIPAGSEIRDAVRVQYKFRVDENTSPNLKLMFGYTSLPAGSDTYVIESNFYDVGRRFTDLTCGSWPPPGKGMPTESTLDIGVPDYVLKGKVATKTFAPTVFPRLNGSIDGIKDLWKTGMISQLNLNGKDVTVEISRGGIVTDRSGWQTVRACTNGLDADAYRQWDVGVTVDGVRYNMAVAIPDSASPYVASWSLLGFRTEFFNGEAVSRLYYWDLQVQRENGAVVRLDRWKVTEHDGYLVDFGVRKASYAGKNVMEISSDGPKAYLGKGEKLDLSL